MDQASQERMNVDASLSNLSMLSDQKLQAAMTHTEKEILKLWESMNLQEQKFVSLTYTLITINFVTPGLVHITMARCYVSLLCQIVIRGKRRSRTLTLDHSRPYSVKVSFGLSLNRFAFWSCVPEQTNCLIRSLN